MFYFINNSNCLNYGKYLNTGLNGTNTSLISIYIKIDPLFCLAQCNMIANCYSVIYTTDGVSNNNCFLYGNFFSLNQKVLSNQSILYEKRGRLKFLFFILHRQH